MNGTYRWLNDNNNINTTLIAKQLKESGQDGNGAADCLALNMNEFKIVNPEESQWLSVDCSLELPLICSVPKNSIAKMPSGYCDSKPERETPNSLPPHKFTTSIGSYFSLTCDGGASRSSTGTLVVQCRFWNSTHGFWSRPTATCSTIDKFNVLHYYHENYKDTTI